MPTPEEQARFDRWLREVDLYLCDFTDATSRTLPDDLRFEWWAWFRGGCSPEHVAQRIVDLITDTQLAALRPEADRLADQSLIPHLGSVNGR